MDSINNSNPEVGEWTPGTCSSPVTDAGHPSTTNISNTSSGSRGLRAIAEKVNHNSKCRCCLWIVALWCAATVVFFLAAYDRVVESVAMGHMVLKESGPKYEAWKNTPMPVYYRVNVFNLTNPRRFMAGDRPRVSECGPYVYKMVEEKTDVSFHKNGSVSYRTRPKYFFVPELSGGSEDDVIWTVNIPFINTADAVKDNPVQKLFINIVKEIHGFDTLRHLSVKELLWGYTSDVMEWARTLQELPYPHPQFGLLVGFNDTIQEPYTMFTGAEDSNHLNRIYSWNGKTKLDFWSGDFCNEIKGTDAAGFHPNVKPSDTLYIFNGQLCRALPLVFNERVFHDGIETYRFTPPHDIFQYGPKYPKNSCFCSGGGCPPRGVLDMKPCYWGAAIGFSFPHFYQADPSLLHLVRGLR